MSIIASKAFAVMKRCKGKDAPTVLKNPQKNETGMPLCDLLIAPAIQRDNPMPVREVCQSFFNNALSPFHQYRKNALTDAPAALISGASLTLSSAGRYMPGHARVRNRIKRADRLLSNQLIQRDIPQMYARIIAMLARHLSLCVIATDRRGYPTREWHLLRASLLCDGRSIPLLSKVVPCELQQNAQVQKGFSVRAGWCG